MLWDLLDLLMRNTLCQMGNKVLVAGCYHCSWLESGPGPVLQERQVMGWRRRRIPWQGSSRTAQDYGAELSLEFYPRRADFQLLSWTK